MAAWKASDDIQESWDELSPKWNAEAKSKYYNQILLPLQNEIVGMYHRVDSLEEFAENCVSSLHI